MKKTKLLVTALIVGILFSGCTQETKKISQKPDKTVKHSTSLGKKDKVEDYDAAGTLVEIDGTQVGIMSGDVIEMFTFKKANIKDFYIGQEVYAKDGKLHAMIKENVKDYEMKYTYMGEIITSVSGKLMSVSKDSIVISKDGKELKFDSYLSEEKISSIQKGTNITIDYIERQGKQWVLNMFNEDHVLNLVIGGIARSESGLMMITADDASGGKFIFHLDSSVDINFNHAELELGDSIEVYPTLIKESHPAQVTVNKVVLDRDVANTKTSGKKDEEFKYEYDAGGEILEIKGDTLTLLSGDIAEDFKFDKKTLENFYVGENVVIKDGKISPYIPKEANYDIDHTSMGEIISSSTGVIKSVDNDSFTATVDGSDIKFGSYLSESAFESLKPGMNITVAHLDRDGGKWAIDFFNEDSTVMLTVTSIGRNAETGLMLIEGIDSSKEKFVMTVPFGLTMNFEHSQLKVDDNVKVYVTSEKDSKTNTVKANKIWRQ